MALHQKWKYDNGFIASMKNPEYVLDVLHGNMQEGAHVGLYKRKPGPQSNQQWRLEPSGHIVSVLNGMALDVEHHDNKQGARLIVWPVKHDKSRNQLWSWGQDGYIRSGMNDMVIDIQHGKMEDGDHIRLWPRD